MQMSRSVRLWELLAGVATIAMLVVGLWLASSHDVAQQAHEEAQKANRKADALIFSSQVQKEKICSQTNQDGACQALFDRLAHNLSRQQRYRLACDVMAALNLPETMQLRKEARCPAPIPSP